MTDLNALEFGAREDLLDGRFSIVKSINYFDLVPLFIQEGLELKAEDPAPEGLFSCFEVWDNEKACLMGGAAICLQDGVYVLKYVAIDKSYQGLGLGRIIMDYVVSESANHGAKQLYLTAKVPGFYTKLGFEIISRKDAPIKTKCFTCPQFHNGCESEVMRLEL